MRQKDRQKLCGNCDGRIPLEAIICPYCAAETVAQSGFQEVDFQKQQSLNDSLSALYPPPYAAKNSHSFEKPPTQFQDVSDRRFTTAAPVGAPAIPTEEAAMQTEDKSSFWPLFLLSVGTNLLMLGLLQLFFSDKGFLRLEWDSSYWFVYCLAAAPLVFLGFKSANRLK